MGAQSPATGSAPRRRRRTAPRVARLATVLIALLAAAPFLASGGLDDFTHLDDGAYVADNRMVLGGLSRAGVRWAFTSFHMGNWHPLTWLSHMFVAGLAGADPWWHHQWNVFLHALNAALLFVALRRLTGAVGRSALAAALFGVHPVHVESVAWVAEHKDVLSGLFFMLVLLAWERHARRPAAGSLAVVGLLLAAGLLAKPMLVTVPFVLLLLDWWPLGRLRGAGGAGTAAWRAALAEKLPLLALALASSAVTYAAQRAAGAVVSPTRLSLAARLANALVSVGEYLRSALWPWPLAVFYPHPGTYPWWHVAAAAAVLGGATAAVLALRRRGFLPAGWLWFVGMLVPVVGLVQVGSQARADRYLYLPLAGLLVAGVWGGPDLPRRWRPPAAWGASALVLALAALCAAQVGLWRDSETLFRHTLAVTRDNGIIHNGLGAMLLATGRGGEAAEHFREAVRSDPANVEALNNLAIVLAGSGQRAAALGHLEGALALAPDRPLTRINLARLLLEMGQPAAAEAHYRAVLARPLSAVDARPHLLANYQLGLLLAAAGRTAQARAHLHAALDLAAGDEAARAEVLAALQRLEDARGPFDP